MASSIKLTNANGKVLTLSHHDTHNEDNVVDVLSTAYTIIHGCTNKRWCGYGV